MRKVLTRAMSLLLSAFMVFSCLVFAAPETATKAEAATAGQYTFKVSLQYMKGSSSGWTKGVLEVFGGDNNGTGSFDATKSGTAGVTKENLYINNSSNTWYEQVGETTVNYFPTTIKYYYSKSYDQYFKVRFKLSIKHSDGTWEEIPLTITRGNCGGNSWAYNAGSCASGDEQGYECNSSSYGEIYATVQSDYMPKPTTVSTSGSTSYTTSVPKDSSTNTVQISTSTTVYDRYGIEWYQEPSYAISSSGGTTTSESISGISITSGASDSATLSVTNAAKDWVSPKDSKTVYVSVNCGGTTLSTIPVTVNAYDVTATFVNEGKTVETKTVKYGNQVTKPADQTKTADGTYHYTFAGWDVDDATLNALKEDITVNAKYTATAHTNKVIETIEPTCITNGSETEECTVCGYKTITTLPANDNHSWGEWVNTYTDCTSNGTATRTCSRCNETETKSIDPQGHDYVAHDAKAATCTEVGWNAYNTCSRCDYTDKIEIAKIAHTPGAEATCTTAQTCTVCGEELAPAKGHTKAEAVKENEVASTCTAKGSYDSVVYCSVCKAELSRNKVELPLVAHTPGAEATCTTAQTCTVCGKELAPAKGHTEAEAVKENEVASTCTAKGSYDSVVYCSVCKAELSRNKVELPLVAHTEAEAVKENEVASTCTKNGSYESVVYCSVCGTEISRDKVELPLVAHTPGAEATCTTAQTCTVCGEELAPAKGHTKAEAVKENEVASTCTAKGSYDSVVYCSVCKAELSRNKVELPLVAHTPGAEATCTTAQTCTVCGKELAPAKGHTEAEAVKENEVASTCTVKGSYDSVVYCSVCKAELSRNKVELPLVAHTEAEAVKENEVASTCTKNGSYESVVYCSVCGAEISRDKVELPLVAHTPGAEATCTTAQTCTVCGEELAPAKGHTKAEAVKENEVASTCTAKGSYDSVVYCSVCKAELSRNKVELPLVAHTEAEAVKENEVASTCTKNGSYESVVYCSVCGAEISRDKVELPLVAHTPGAEATCTTAQTCTVCGDELAPAKGHTMTKTEFVPATCQHTGVMEYYTCSVCNKIFADEAGEKAITLDDTVIEIADHELVNHDAQAPTCDEIGWDAYVTCKNCDYTTYSEKAALGHDYSEFVSETPATCTEEGTTIYKCVRCDETEMNTTSALGHDISVLVSDTPATCTAKGEKVYKCVRCEEKKTVITDALGHNFGEWKVVTEATETTAGLKRRECTRCDVYEEETIPVSAGKRVIKFVNIDKMHYVLDNDGEEYYVYNSGSVYWDKNRPLNFTVYTYSNFAYSDVIVKVNGVEISPDANGVYTVPAGDSLAVVTVTGAVDNGDGTKLSFWEWLVRLFKKIFSAFGSLFGGNSGSNS